MLGSVAERTLMQKSVVAQRYECFMTFIVILLLAWYDNNMMIIYGPINFVVQYLQFTAPL